MSTEKLPIRIYIYIHVYTNYMYMYVPSRVFSFNLQLSGVLWCVIPIRDIEIMEEMPEGGSLQSAMVISTYSKVFELLVLAEVTCTLYRYVNLCSSMCLFLSILEFYCFCFN